MFACLGVVFAPHVCNLDQKLRILAGLSSFPSPAPKKITQITRKLGQSGPFHALLDKARLHIMAEITGLPRLAPPPPQTESHSQSLT